MNIASAALVSFMLLDLVQPSLLPAAPEQQTTHSATGKGELSVVVSPPAPVGSVPKGAQRVQYLTLSLSASCDAPIVMDSLEIRHTGLGRASDIASVYAYDLSRRFSRGTHFSAGSSRATLRFRAFTVPKCGAVEIQVMGDMSTDSVVGSEHGMEVTSVDNILSSAKTTTLTVGDDTEKVVAMPTRDGTITVRFLPVHSSLSYGRRETVARIQLTADRTNAHLLKHIMLTNTGDARDMDLQYMSLETLAGSGLTAPSTRMHGYTAVFDFDPTYVIHAGQTIVLNLKAEIHASQGKAVDFTLEEPSDLVAMPYRDR